MTIYSVSVEKPPGDAPGVDVLYMSVYIDHHDIIIIHTCDATIYLYTKQTVTHRLKYTGLG